MGKKSWFKIQQRDKAKYRDPNRGGFQKDALKSSKSLLLPVFLVLFVDNFGYSLVFNMLGPMVLKAEYGMMAASISVHVKNAILALVFGIFPLAQFFAAPLIGDFGDIYGRKKAFYLSLSGMTLGFTLSAWAIVDHNIVFFLFSRLLTGLFAGNMGVCMASIADLSPDEGVRGKNFSTVTALFGISWVAAMVLGGYVATPKLLGSFGPVFAFLFTALLTLINFFLILLLFKDTAPKSGGKSFHFWKGGENIKEMLHLNGSKLYFFVYFLWSLGWVIAVQWYPPYSIEVYQASVASFTSWYVVMGILWILGASFAKYTLFNKYKSVNIGLFGFGAMTICLFLMQPMGTFFLFSLFFVLGAFFSPLAMSSSLNLISVSASEKVQGKIMGISQSLQSISFVLVSTIAFLVSIDTLSILFYFAAVISLAGFILLFYKAKK